jgi:hypothetical protein
VVTNTISTTTKMDIQYNEGGDVQFVRTSDPVRIPDEATGTVKNGTAVAVIEYTGQLLKSCSGADLGRERVLAWDSLFGKDYVRLVANAPDVRSFRIALDADSTKDLGVDPKTGQRVFQTVADDVAFNLSVNTRGDPTSVTASTGPAGVSALLVPKDPRETLGPTEGLTPPSCQN